MDKIAKSKLRISIKGIVTDIQKLIFLQMDLSGSIKNYLTGAKGSTYGYKKN
jgi:hypothetical protein